MPKVQGQIKLNGAPPISFDGKVDTLKDCKKFFKGADRQVTNALRVFSSLKDAKVTGITLRVG